MFRKIVTLMVLSTLAVVGFTLSASGASTTDCIPHTGMHCKRLSSSTTTTTTTAPAQTGVGDIVLTDKSFKCDGPVNLNSVTVTITRSANASDAVRLREGCTGFIGTINVTNYKGDGIKLGNAHDLVIGGGTIRCFDHSDGKHQDGVQALGGDNVTFYNLDVGCYSANNSQVWINEGSGGSNPPTKVVFEGGKFDGQGSGSYGVVIGNSISSGFRNATVCPNAHPARQFKVFDGAIDPVNDNNLIASSC